MAMLSSVRGVLKMCEAMQEYPTPRAKADPRLDILESTFSGLLCSAEGEVSESSNITINYSESKREKTELNAAIAALSFYLLPSLL